MILTQMIKHFLMLLIILIIVSMIMLLLVSMIMLLLLCMLLLLESLVGCLNLYPILKLIIVTKFQQHPSPICPTQVPPILFLPTSLIPIYLLPKNPIVAQFVPTQNLSPFHKL